MPRFLFPDGIATPTGAYVIVQVIGDDGNMIPGNVYADYRFREGAEGFATDWEAVSLCEAEGGPIYAAGENGEVLVISETGAKQEFIAPDTDGPEIHGPIREIRSIGGDIYAVGMGRQFYRRTRNGVWIHADAGMLDSEAVDVGLTSVAGDGAGFMVAVGYGGEIWEHEHVWRRADSPTNLLLTRVIRHVGTYYAAGMSGTLLRRAAVGWQYVDSGGFSQDMWDLESFSGTLFLGTSGGLHRLTLDEEIVAVNEGEFKARSSCASLSAGYGRIWGFCSGTICSSSDGRRWREEMIF